MSALAASRQPRQPAARGRILQRARYAGRSRRAGAGTVTEMARSLLRDARDAGVAQAGSGRRGASADDGLSHAVAAEKQSSRVASAENQLSAVA